jgi:alpha-L-fucosidase
MKNFFNTYLKFWCISLFILGTPLGRAQDSQKKTKPIHTIKINETDSKEVIVSKAAKLVPTDNQYAYKKLEFTAFIHFGPNTFSKREWGSGMEDPKIFDVKKLNTDQWCAAMKSAGMKLVVLTAKHHDGFCLWQSRYTKQGIISSPFQNGKGDIVKSLAKSCKKYGLKLGIYLSPADLYQMESPEGLYGNLSKPTERTIPKQVKGRPFINKTTFNFVVDDYNEYFLNQLFELLTEYGPVDEVWFDGAHPKTKGGQTYNYQAWKTLIKKLAPKAVIFGKEGVRWCGNESGKTRETEWDIIPFDVDPLAATLFPDLTDQDLGSREKLYTAKYLHFQPTETNTSIREGWFYRDDHDQKVRSADDVFDIYERSVGGNSNFLLNIPPNREGEFSEEDVNVLTEVGKRIRETYDVDLLKGVKESLEFFDNNEFTHAITKEVNGEFILSTPFDIKINRFLIQEDIAKTGQRVEEHALDAWIGNKWVEIARGTTIGYKKILRFNDITAKKFRIRILKSRMQPEISKISAHYYNARPPQIEISRDNEGIVSLFPKNHAFGWKVQDSKKDYDPLADLEIRYTTDGSLPNKNSKIYAQSFPFQAGEIKALAFQKGKSGSVSSTTFGILKKDWRLIEISSEDTTNIAKNAFDNNEKTYWSSKAINKPQFLSIDLGKEYTITGFVYTPQQNNPHGMIEKGEIKISDNGKDWKVLESFEFGNLINDPTKRSFHFKKEMNIRYIKIESVSGANGSKSASIAEIDFLVNLI